MKVCLKQGKRARKLLIHYDHCESWAFNWCMVWTKIKKTVGRPPHPQLKFFDRECTTVDNAFPARLRTSFSAAPTDACKPIPLAELNDPVPHTGDHPRRYAIVGLCDGKLTETVEEKRFYLHNPSHSARPRRRRQKAFKNQTVSLGGVYVWDVNSTVTKYSDYFVWKDMSERVTRRWLDTSWQEASEFLPVCI